MRRDDRLRDGHERGQGEKGRVGCGDRHGRRGALGSSGGEQLVTVNFELFEWDKVYINPLYGRCRPQVDMPKLLRHYAKGDLLLDEMITRTYPIGKVRAAFDDMLSGRNAKSVLVM